MQNDMNDNGTRGRISAVSVPDNPLNRPIPPAQEVRDFVEKHRAELPAYEARVLDELAMDISNIAPTRFWESKAMVEALTRGLDLYDAVKARFPHAGEG